MSDGPVPTFAVQTSSLLEVLQVIEDGGIEVAFAVDDDGRLAGIMTDGDVRRALLAGASVEERAEAHLSRTPLTAHERESRSVVLDIMRARVISQIPIVDDGGRLVGVHTLQGLLGRQPRPTTAVILAGGRGTRLHPLTHDVPKAMVPVAGRPILERIITHLVGYGIRDVVLAVGHLSESIVSFFGDGSAFGCRVRYLVEDPATPLGTCGPLGGLEDLVGRIEHPLLVMNGDLLTSVDIEALLSFHEESESAMTVATKVFPLQVPYAVLDHAGGRVTRLVEKPVLPQVINIGIYVLDRSCLDSVPRGTGYDMTDLVTDLIAADRQVGIWESHDDWIDIGSPSDLWRARGRSQD